MISLTQSGIHKDYILQASEYGRGHYGVVRKATDRWTGEEVAVKVISKVGDNGGLETHLIQREIDIMKDVDHPNVVRMFACYESRSHFHIVMEPVTGGQLLDRIVAKEHYSETEAADCFLQIISAVKYLHQIGIVHRDLKPENVLYASPDPDSPLKICDFGLSLKSDIEELEAGRARMWSKCGSPDYVAPEVLGRSGYGKECDVWSCGCILYVLLCGFAPFGQDTLRKKFSSICRGKFNFPSPYWDHVSDDAKVRRVEEGRRL
ncbi:hypothetical protein GUITHDRAFT_84186 [Guillardia theta CCMP2712]|uniref:Protein kinase domain-containing protein n=1 Tax=Guillardia theta (strain CCMP2712) TaxID=905079 RepID=L1K0V6_GUITC|nr:hypothetical protein GUITHDRAFT_84186 [Guillardia theta CCMP2712]EKX54189.1 hypothetical protein GUITHDRAFT_84186 [Guillardia theta CCMP2712]|eukprot:XP_005841169.1 hypothetical protein GUITHDRAFT_84186 [Guillardia theta CCMP2712]